MAETADDEVVLHENCRLVDHQAGYVIERHLLEGNDVYEEGHAVEGVLGVAQLQREAEERAPRVWRLGAPARAGPRAEGREPKLRYQTEMFVASERTS